MGGAAALGAGVLKKRHGTAPQSGAACDDAVKRKEGSDTSTGRKPRRRARELCLCGRRSDATDLSLLSISDTARARTPAPHLGTAGLAGAHTTHRHTPHRVRHTHRSQCDTLSTDNECATWYLQRSATQGPPRPARRSSFSRPARETQQTVTPRDLGGRSRHIMFVPERSRGNSSPTPRRPLLSFSHTDTDPPVGAADPVDRLLTSRWSRPRESQRGARLSALMLLWRAAVLATRCLLRAPPPPASPGG